MTEGKEHKNHMAGDQNNTKKITVHKGTLASE